MPIDNELKTKLEWYFSELGPRPDFKVAIHRAEPDWCAGYIETIDIYDSDDLTLNRIRDEYGGGKFYIKIMDSRCRYLENRTITISGDPLRHGQKIEDDQMSNNPDETLAECDYEITKLQNQVEVLTEQMEEIKTVLMMLDEIEEDDD